MTTPRSLAHFPSDKSPRPEQTQALTKIENHFDSGSDVVAFQGPTGSGKSFVALSVARETRAAGGNTSLLTAQKVLQNQYAEDFPAPEIEVMKGRSNYGCSYDPLSRNASSGYCRREKNASLIEECLSIGTVEMASKFELPAEAHRCDYWRQMTKSVKNPITLFNFHSFLYQQRLGRFGRRNLLIIDECHNTESVLLQYVQLTLSDKLLKTIGIRLDLSLKTAKDVVAWVEREQISSKILEVLGHSARTENTPASVSPSEGERLKTLLDRIDDLLKYIDLTEWVVDVTTIPDEEDEKDWTRKLRVRPIFISLFAKELIFSKADKTLAMSATILDPKIWARNLGISGAALGYVDIPCLFPVKNRPIILDYAGDMGWHKLEDSLPKTYLKIARLLRKHEGQRGIIHAHSERLTKLIVEHIKSPRFLHLDMFPGRNKTDLLKAHMDKPDSVIVASAFHEGVDLKDDASRFQIIPKVPWPGTEDPLVKARMNLDGSYLPYQAALKLIQASGRSVRHKDDWATTYITDSAFDKFMSRCGWLLPKWFTEAIDLPSGD